MRIVVMSPLNRSGCTVVTTMLAQAAALTQDMHTMVTYTSKARTLPQYLNLGGYLSDRTRSISQVVKLLQARAISVEELNDFAIKVAANFYLMDTVSETITDEEALMVQKYVFTNTPADLVICDVTEAIDDVNAQELIDVADALCVVLNPDYVSVEMFQLWKESEYWPKNKPYMVVINRYDDAVIGVRQFAKHCGIETKFICKLHYNPLLVKSCNDNFLAEIVPYAYEKDIRVLQLRNDLKEMMSWVTNTSGSKLVWEK